MRWKYTVYINKTRKERKYTFVGCASFSNRVYPVYLLVKMWKCRHDIGQKMIYTFQTNLWNHSQFQLCRSFSQIGLNVSMMVNILEMRMYFCTLCITMFSMFCLLTGYQKPAHVGLWISVVGKNLFFFRIVLNRWNCLFKIE